MSDPQQRCREDAKNLVSVEEEVPQKPALSHSPKSPCSVQPPKWLEQYQYNRLREEQTAARRIVRNPLEKHSVEVPQPHRQQRLRVRSNVPTEPKRLFPALHAPRTQACAATPGSKMAKSLEGSVRCRIRLSDEKLMIAPPLEIDGVRRVPLGVRIHYELMSPERRRAIQSIAVASLQSQRPSTAAGFLDV